MKYVLNHSDYHCFTERRGLGIHNEKPNPLTLLDSLRWSCPWQPCESDLSTSPAPVPAQLSSVFYPMEEEGWGKGLGNRVAEGLNILIWSTKYM